MDEVQAGNKEIIIDPKLEEAVRLGEQAMVRGTAQPSSLQGAAPVLDLTKKPATIALCMIVKDEEKRLPDSLRSSLPLVDEVVIVDTGSTDKTLGILRQAKQDWAKVLHKDKDAFTILEKPWAENFSEMRNYGLSFATADFVLQLDADECIVANEHLLRDAAERAWRGDLQRVGAFFFHLYNVLQDGKKTFILHPHLFRRVGLHTGALFRFQGHVHNRPIWEGQSTDCPMLIEHYGYGEDPATMLKKHARRRKMVMDWIDREPESFWAHFYAAQTISAEAGNGSSQRAIEVAKRALELRHNDPNVPESSDARCYYSWLICLVRDKNADEVIKIAEQALAVLPWYPDPWFFLAWAHMHQGSWQKCCQACMEFFDAQERCVTDPEIQRQFIGVENLTIGAGPNVAGFWRYAARHCHGCNKAANQEPRLEILGIDAQESTAGVEAICP